MDKRPSRPSGASASLTGGWQLAGLFKGCNSCAFSVSCLGRLATDVPKPGQGVGHHGTYSGSFAMCCFLFIFCSCRSDSLSLFLCSFFVSFLSLAIYCWLFLSLCLSLSVSVSLSLSLTGNRLLWLMNDPPGCNPKRPPCSPPAEALKLGVRHLPCRQGLLQARLPPGDAAAARQEAQRCWDQLESFSRL